MICQKSIIFVVLLTISFSARIQCEGNELNIDLDKIKENLPPGINIPPELQNMTLPSLDEFKKAIKEKCAKVMKDGGGDKAYEAIVKGATELQECTTGLIDMEILQKEINDAQPTGELDTVFNKYCRKRDIAINCTKNFTTVLEPCLEPKEIESKRTFIKIFTNVLNFVCHKEGDQIALFIAEKGPECFEEQKDRLLKCVETTFKPYIPAEKEINTTAIPNELPELVMGEQQCNDMDILQNCVVQSLESCTESTPANLVESMFKFVRNETPCVNMTSKVLKQTGSKSPNDAYINSSSSVLVTSIFAFFVLRSIP